MRSEALRYVRDACRLSGLAECRDAAETVFFW